MTDAPVKKPRGFAAMSPEQRRGDLDARAAGQLTRRAPRTSSRATKPSAAGRKGGLVTIARHRARKQAEAGVIDADFDG